jgi:hypothetical protein
MYGMTIKGLLSNSFAPRNSNRTRKYTLRIGENHVCYVGCVGASMLTMSDNRNFSTLRMYRAALHYLNFMPYCLQRERWMIRQAIQKQENNVVPLDWV